MTRQDIDRIVRGLNFANVFCWSRANMATPGTDAAKLLMASAIACEDAAKLLDAWEPVAPKVEGDGETHWYGCGSCGAAIDPKDKFCRHCGAGVKWDAAD